MNWYKYSQFTEENMQSANTPMITVYPYEPVIQETVNEIQQENPNFFVGINKINLISTNSALGSVESTNPSDININMNNIKYQLQNQLNQPIEPNNPQHKEALKSAIKEVIVHEKAHVQDAIQAQEKSDIPLEGKDLFPGGETPAEIATQNLY